VTVYSIPIADVTAQSFTVALSGQQTEIRLYQNSTGLYCDVSVNNTLIIAGVLCLNLNEIVRDAYLGFIGDLYFLDTQGLSDPSSPGLGARYQFLYTDALV
jgi:hypothetical protein